MATLVLAASGPHVLRGVQLFQNALIAYSVGNFARAGNGLATEGILGQGAILSVTLHADGTLVSGRLLPVQLTGGDPHRIYGSSDVVRRVNALSHADFGTSAVRVSDDDRLNLG